MLYLFFHFLLPVVWPFLGGGLIAVLLRPAALSLRKWTNMAYKPSAVAACLLFYGVFGVLLWNLGFLLFVQGVALFTRLPNLYVNSIRPSFISMGDWFRSFVERFFPGGTQQLNSMTAAVGETLQASLTSLSAAALKRGADFASHLPGFVFSLSFIILSSFFILMDYEQVTHFLFRQLPPQLRRLVRDAKRYIVDTGKNVVKAYFLLMLITFLEVSAGLWLLQVEYFAVIGLIVAVVDILPILGSGSILIPWGLYLLLTGSGPRGAAILILYGVVTMVRTIIEPKILGDRIGLNPLITVFSMYLGMKLGGFGGLILAPMAMTLLLHLNRSGHFQIFR